jgi:hypothetical protein
MTNMDLQLDSVVVDSGEGLVTARLLLDGQLIWTTPPTTDDDSALALLKTHVAQSLTWLLTQSPADPTKGTDQQ